MPIDGTTHAAIQSCDRMNAVSRPGGPAECRETDNGGDKDSARLTKACAEFEALLVQKLFQTMRASIPKSGLIDGGSAEEIYTAMLDQQVAQEMALRGGLGLADRMKAQIIGYLNVLNGQND